MTSFVDGEDRGSACLRGSQTGPCMLNLSVEPPTSPEAQALGEAYLVFHENITRIMRFRAVSVAGLEAGAAAAQERFLSDRRLLNLLGDFGQSAEEALRRLKPVVLERSRNDATASSDAACLILAHSVFEALVHELMDVLPSTRGKVIRMRIADRKLRIGDLEPTTIDALLASEVRNYVSDLKRESLRNKLSLIFDCCGFDKNCQEQDYSFDQDRLVAIDKERQKIVHQAIFESALPNIEATLAFLEHTGDFLVCLVSRATGSEVNIRSAMTPLVRHVEEESNAFHTAMSLARSVDEAMNHFADAATAGHITQPQNDETRAAYADYQTAMKSALDAVRRLKLGGDADHAELNSDLARADAAGRALLLLIESSLSHEHPTPPPASTDMSP